MILKPPFDNLETLNELIRSFKKGESTHRLSSRYKTERHIVRNALVFSGVLGEKQKEKSVITKVKPKGKYDYLIFEPTNPGKNYRVLLEEQGIKKWEGPVFFSKKDIIKNRVKKPPRKVVGDCD